MPFVADMLGIRTGLMPQLDSAFVDTLQTNWRFGRVERHG